MAMPKHVYQCSESEILEAMHRYGGGFVKQLAVLYRLGDEQNRDILAAAFGAYFVQYDELARMSRADASR